VKAQIEEDFKPRKSGAILIQGSRVLDPANQRDEILDVLVVDGRIAKIDRKISNHNAEIIEGKGFWLTPGFIDMHVHLRDPGMTHKETIETGARLAANSGFTTIVAMPNTEPVVDNAQVVSYVRVQGRKAGAARVLTTGAITVGQKGEQLAPMIEMHEAGCVGFTDDGRPVMNAALMRHALEYAKTTGLKVISHAEDLTMSASGHMNEGHVSCLLGIGGIPSAAEEVCIARDLILQELTKGSLHIAHVSTAGGIQMIREAKKRGNAVSCEVTPHHFSLTDEMILNYRTNAKMNPPLRSQSDIDALIEAMVDGTIDCIATDHAPHSTLEKDLPFDQAAFGITGLETALPLTLELVTKKKISELRAIEMLTCGPAQILELPVGHLSVGALADVTLINPSLVWSLTHSQSLSQNTPFWGRQMRGRAVFTMVAGEVVYNSLRRDQR